MSVNYNIYIEYIINYIEIFMHFIEEEAVNLNEGANKMLRKI